MFCIKFGLFFSLTARQIDLKADVNTALITELSPQTDYTFTIHAVYPSRLGDSATITVQTSGCHACLGAPVVDFIVLRIPKQILSFSPSTPGVKLPRH